MISLDQFELIKNKRILVGTPTYENHVMINHHKSMISLISSASANGMQIDYMLGIHDSLIPRMRNNIATTCLKEDYDYLLFIDSDVSFDVEDVFNLIYTAITKDMKVVAGPYPKKNIFWELIDKAIKNNLIHKYEDYQKYASAFSINFEDISKFDPEKPFEVIDASSGFMLISKDIFSEFLTKYPEQLAKDDNGNDLGIFFESKLDHERKIFLSEDFFFCKMVRNMGHKIWLLPYIKLDHMGTTTFYGKFEDYMNNMK